MGQRANLVICRNGDWRLFYDHWRANVLDVDLFWGAQYAAEFIQQRRAVVDRNDWLDEVWCEGGAVIDFDHRLLLWFGGEDIVYNIPLRLAYLRLMAERWPGWQIKWASLGIVELGGYLDFPAEKFLKSGDTDPSESFWFNAKYPEDNPILLTVRDAAGVTMAQLSGDEESLELGRSYLTHILSFPRRRELNWLGPFPRGGVHIDLERRQLFYWFARKMGGLCVRIAEGWKDWDCIHLEMNYQRHLELAQIPLNRLPQRPVAELQRAVIAHLRRSCDMPASNPAKDLLAKLDEDAVLNPLTEETRGSFGSKLTKHRILDELERRLPLN